MSAFNFDGFKGPDEIEWRLRVKQNALVGPRRPLEVMIHIVEWMEEMSPDDLMDVSYQLMRVAWSKYKEEETNGTASR